MKTVKLSVLTAFFCLIPAVCLFLASQEKAAQPSVKKKELESFIRKELLRQNIQESGLPKRNIFSPRSSAGAVSSTPGQLPGRGQAGIGSNEAEALADNRPGQPEFSFTLRYIGYIESARRTIGLIFLDGQARAVAEGEVIRDGIRVGKISSTQIEITLPDSTIKKFSLEGE